MSVGDKVVLAVEAAIAGGSLSLLHGGREIAGWTGTSDVSRAEELLPAIDQLLLANDIPKTDVGLIAVSAGPGSFTGIRIGIATALGLSSGLGVPMASESALRAIAFAAGSQGLFTVAVPVGREAVCLQRFAKGSDGLRDLSEPETVRERDLLGMIKSGDGPFLVHTSIFAGCGSPNAVDVGRNIASAIGQICWRQRDIVREPLFISKSF